MQPEIHLGALTLQTFGIAFALAFVASGSLFARRLYELGKPVDWAYEGIFAALIGGLVGSRLDYIVQNWDQVSGDVFGNVFSGSGLVFFGGLIGGAVGVLIWARWRGFIGWTLLDSAAAPIAIGYTVGRIGCQVSGDGDYGEPSDLPWAMAYPDGTVPTTQEVHPTPVYETFTMGLVAWFLWSRRHSMRPGGLFALYLVLSGTERFLVEFLRRNDRIAAGLTLPQLIAVGLVVVGSVWLARMRSTGGVPAPARG